MCSLSVQAEERQDALDAPVYTINPASAVRAVDPRRMGGVDFDKAGPFGGQRASHPFHGKVRDAKSRQGGGRQGAQHGDAREDAAGGWESGAYSTTLSSGFGISEAGAARLMPEVLADLRARHRVDVRIDRMQLGASRSFPMVCCINFISECMSQNPHHIGCCLNRPMALVACRSFSAQAHSCLASVLLFYC